MNFEQYTNSKLYTIFDKLYKLIMLNLIWIATVAIGFGVITLFPATIALSVLLNSINLDQEFSLLRSFFTVFKKEFRKSQKLFLVLMLFGLLIGFDLVYFIDLFLSRPSMMNAFIVWLFLFISIFYAMVLIHIGPVYVYFPRLSIKNTIKLAGMFSIRYLFHSLLLLVMHAALILLVFFWPIFFPVFPILYFSGTQYVTLKLLGSVYRKYVREGTPLVVTDYFWQTPVDHK